MVLGWWFTLFWVWATATDVRSWCLLFGVMVVWIVICGYCGYVRFGGWLGLICLLIVVYGYVGWFIVIRLSFVVCLIATVVGCGVCRLILALVVMFCVGGFMLLGLVLSVVIWFILLFGGGARGA